MNASQYNQIARSRALLPVAGEQLVSGAISVAAIINRTPEKSRLKRYMGDSIDTIDFSLQGLTTIEILFSALATAPVAGQSFIDGFNFRHRVQVVQQTDVSWILICNMAPVTPD